MTIAVDTNVIIALWDKDSALNLAAQNALDTACNRGILVAAAPVFAELISAPGRSEAFVGSLFEETGIGVDWELPEQVWRAPTKSGSPRICPAINGKNDVFYFVC